MQIIVNTFGASLSVDNESLVVKNHSGERRIPSEAVSSILLCRGVSLTTDVLFFCIKREIEVLFIDRSGRPEGRVWSHRYGSISTIRKGQLAFASSELAVAWVKALLARKIENQQALLMTMDSYAGRVGDNAQRAVARMDTYRDKVLGLEGRTVDEVAETLRGWEGNAAKIYFDAMNDTLPAHYRFNERSRRPALDVANALLNYGYGMLYGRVEGALIRAGIDPYVGIMHRDEYNRPVLVYDVIEVFRVWVDYVVWQLLRQEAVDEEYYSVSDDGGVWLEQLGRRVMAQSLNDYLADVVEMEGLKRRRETHIDLYCQRLAQLFQAAEAKP